VKALTGRSEKVARLGLFPHLSLDILQFLVFALLKSPPVDPLLATLGLALLRRPLHISFARFGESLFGRRRRLTRRRLLGRR